MGTPTLRGYQNDCITGIHTAIRAGHRKIKCVLPTGSGKTTIFGAFLRDVLLEDPYARAVVVSHLGLLTSQTRDRFQSEWGIKSGILQADKLPKSDERCVITTMQSFREANKIEAWARSGRRYSARIEDLNVRYIIIDESHFAGAESYTTIMDLFPNAVIIGFTATPFRQNKLMTNLFDTVAYTCSMQDMIDQGHLVPPKLNLVPFNTVDEADIYAKIVAIYNEKHKGQKAVVYMKTIEQAEMCRNILIASGIESSAVTSKLTGEPRDRLLKEFRNGDGPDVLTTVDVLTAGFDSPNLRALFMPYKVGSVTTYLQRVGRGLRPHDQKDYCDIYAGANSPGIESGFWERITEEILVSGKPMRDFDNLMDILEFKDQFKEEEIKWTMDVVNMAKDAQSKGMDKLFDMIVTRQFPDDLLGVLVDVQPGTGQRKSNARPTPKQISYLQRKGLYQDGLSKAECSALIEAQMRKEGWQPPADEIVPSGKHKGKHFSKVPPLYWAHLSRYSGGGELMKAYNAYKAKVGGRK